MVTATTIRSQCTCGADIATTIADTSRHISTHASSHGRVIYFRCTCGSPHVAVIRLLAQLSGT
jgi:hypothetical protein